MILTLFCFVLICTIKAQSQKCNYIFLRINVAIPNSIYSNFCPGNVIEIIIKK